MLTVRGIPASPGFAAGPACPVISQAIEVTRYRVENVDTELARLDLVLAVARKQLADIAAHARDTLPAAEAAIFDAHLLILDDPDLGDQVRQQVQREGCNAEAAWEDATNAYAQILAGMENEYLAARAADVRDVGRRVLRLLMNLPEESFSGAGPAVIIARDLTPSDTVRLDRRRVLAFCTAEGGPTSHTAILAKSLGIPAVVGAGAQLLSIPAGTHLLVDGGRGEVLADPEPAAADDFHARSAHYAGQAAEALRQAADPALTRDGQRVEVVANIGGVEDARAALAHGAEGVGLFRTEFLYLDRQQAPGEEEQAAAYAAVMEVMGSRPVVVRTMDIGGDKELPYLNLGREANPFLGCRAIRISLAEPEMFKVQLRALLRAAAGTGRDMRIMFPMIATLAEVRQAKALLAEARQEIQAAGAPLPGHVQAGIMVEIPSVVVQIEQFAREVDFFSIGTNDLTQYTFAAERTNEKVAYLADACHPAILRQIQAVIQAAHRRGIWAGVCGELAGDPEAAPLLLGLGLDEFSMAPAQIPRIKAVLRQWSAAEAGALAERALEQESAETVRALVRAGLRG